MRLKRLVSEANQKSFYFVRKHKYFGAMEKGPINQDSSYFRAMKSGLEGKHMKPLCIVEMHQLQFSWPMPFSFFNMVEAAGTDFGQFHINFFKAYN